MRDAVGMALSLTLQNVEFLKSQIKKADAVTGRKLEAFPKTFTIIPGIGPVFGAGIVSEIEDISRFRNQAALARHAGLTWTRYQSGGFEAKDRYMTKAGNRYLRYYLIEAANSLRVHNEEYKRYHRAKYKEVP